MPYPVMSDALAKQIAETVKQHMADKGFGLLPIDDVRLQEICRAAVIYYSLKG
jgi:hypothetical protein